MHTSGTGFSGPAYSISLRHPLLSRRIKSKCYPGVRDQAQSDHVYDVSRCCFLSPPLDQALLPNSWKRISRARTTNAPPWRLSERSLMICLERP